MSNDTPDDGGNAFPADASTNLFSRGMTLRDYFAAKAMEGLLACPDTDWQGHRERAAFAYAQADEMLKARQV